ncbi:acyl-CoA/acyl-ACP dehydrogenase [Aldersonia sp. NBC_00410]|uniref:acyl-CoA dehydrogenase family protein n=1 Tax=Aldersonia sp. NBC_00410 TaxID=2975954 RepID=UPI002255C4F3|nr:acyl-CoA dehydrogenase family protein [Aldersonia sp. NBC_00410]MCX5042074.1 acyl-CoA/acyl-ACP dehydrogenase [Aldersonia sp. NBC_00410]
MTITAPAPAPVEHTLDPVSFATDLGRKIQPFSESHDRAGTFVAEAYELFSRSGYFALAVPEELGGYGASIRDVAAAQRTLARFCGSSALASAMHQHVTLFTAWRYRRGLPGAEKTLRRIVQDAIVLVSTGGADATHPRGSARRVDGGYRVSGRKIFCSQAPVGTVMSTMFPYADPESGRIVLNMAVPLGAEGVTVQNNWDALGMRGTGSHDIELDEVFVPDAAVLARRPYGVLDPPLQVIFSIALPVVAAVYLGVAEAARDAAVAAVRDTSKAANPLVQRAVGLMNNRLQVASWALDGALDAVGDDPAPMMETVVAVMAAKREIAHASIEVCDIAMEVTGGQSYYRGTIERCYRDVRAAKFHPFTPEETLQHAGLVGLGLPPGQH